MPLKEINARVERAAMGPTAEWACLRSRTHRFRRAWALCRSLQWWERRRDSIWTGWAGWMGTTDHLFTHPHQVSFFQFILYVSIRFVSKKTKKNVSKIKHLDSGAFSAFRYEFIVFFENENMRDIWICPSENPRLILFLEYNNNLNLCVQVKN